MSKGTSIKDAIKMFEEKKSAAAGAPVVAAEQEKARVQGCEPCSDCSLFSAIVDYLHAPEDLVLRSMPHGDHGAG